MTTRIENWSNVLFVALHEAGRAHMVNNELSWFTYCGLSALGDARLVSDPATEVCGNCPRAPEALEAQSEVA